MKIPRGITRGQGPLELAAKAEAVEWDEYGQAYNAAGETVVCICGHAYPLRGAPHYCSYDDPEPERILM